MSDSNVDSNAIVVMDKPPAYVPKTDPPKSFILNFGKNLFEVPASAVKSYPKKPNRLESPEALGLLLATKSPEAWFPYCQEDALMKIGGEEGTCVYTTFHVDGYPDEVRMIRFISGTIAEKNFPRWKEQLKDTAPEGERKILRREVLNWSKAKDCPSRAQINPELNHWKLVDKESEKAVYPKSCKVDPEHKKRSGTNKKRRSETKDDEGGGVPKRATIVQDKGSTQTNTIEVLLGEEGTYIGGVIVTTGKIHKVVFTSIPQHVQEKEQRTEQGFEAGEDDDEL
jgi:hypothetical protein